MRTVVVGVRPNGTRLAVVYLHANDDDLARKWAVLKAITPGDTSWRTAEVPVSMDDTQALHVAFNQPTEGS